MKTGLNIINMAKLIIFGNFFVNINKKSNKNNKQMIKINKINNNNNIK